VTSPRVAAADAGALSERGWAVDYRPWLPEEEQFLREHVDTLSAKQIARRLGRSCEFIIGRAETLLLIRHTGAGYSARHLSKLFGARTEKVRRWIERGLFGRAHHYGAELRIPEADVLRFIHTRHREYDLARVHQKWYKALVLSAETTREEN
jgi:hypothetical protein